MRCKLIDFVWSGKISIAFSTQATCDCILRHHLFHDYFRSIRQPILNQSSPPTVSSICARSCLATMPPIFSSVKKRRQ